MSKGWIYRTGVAIKDFGERLGHIKVLGVHVFGWCYCMVIRFGLAVRDFVMGYPIGEHQNFYNFKSLFSAVCEKQPDAVPYPREKVPLRIFLRGVKPNTVDLSYVI